MQISVKELKEAYEDAKKKELKVVKIQGLEFVIDYLKYLIEHLEVNLKAKPHQIIEIEPQEKEEEKEEWNIVYAEHGEGFQEYKYKDGKRVPAGEPIGIEKGNELKLLDEIYYSDEAEQ